MATRYISTTGNDTTGDGTEGNPWATIAKAYASSASGDTIVAAAGTYAMYGQQAWQKNLTLIGAGSTLTILDGGGGYSQLTANYASTICVFQDLQFYRFGGTYRLIDIFGGCDWTFRRCGFRSCYPLGNNQGGLIASGQGMSGVETITIDACWFYDCDCYDAGESTVVNLAAFGATQHNLNVFNTLFLFTTSGARQFNNWLMLRWAHTFNLTIKNNIFYSNSGTSVGGIRDYSGSAVLVLDFENNCWSGVTQQPGTGDILADPLLWDVGSLDFRLRAKDGSGNPNPS
jgi:hypothetical protein